MATQITQIDLPKEHRTILRVEGDLMLEDAVLIERISRSIREETGNRIIIDLAELDLLDSDAASVLKRLEKEQSLDIEGAEIFVQSAVDMAERS